MSDTMTQGAYYGLTPQQAVQRANAQRGVDSTGLPIGWRGDGATLTSDQASARASINGFLSNYGLAGLGDRVWNWYLSGIPIEQIMLDIRGTNEYKQRFPAMESLGKSGHAISETDYVNLESSYKQLMRQAGLPEGFYDTPDDFTAFIGGEVSPSELAKRLDDYTNITYNLPPTVRQYFADTYGMSNADVTAYIIDPTRALPILDNQIRAAQAGGAAIQSGFGNLTKTEAESIAQLGVDFNSALSGFNQLAGASSLFNPLGNDAGENAITRDEQIGAAFGGNAAAQQRIANRAAHRKATYAEGGGFSNFGSASS